MRRPSAIIRRDALLTFALCALLGGFVFVETAGYPVPQGQGFGSGPAFYPRVLAAAMAVIGLLHLVGGRRRRPPETAAGERGMERAAPAFGRVALFFALSLAAVLAMPRLGFLASGFLLVFLTTLSIRGVFTGRGAAEAALYAAGIMAVIWAIFSVLVGIQLPPAALFR